MGGLSAAFSAFDAAWRDPARIQAHASEFLREWTAIKDALSERIMAEENLLYMLSESAPKQAG